MIPLTIVAVNQCHNPQCRIFHVVQCKASQVQQGGLHLQHLVNGTDVPGVVGLGDHLTVWLSCQLSM